MRKIAFSRLIAVPLAIALVLTGAGATAPAVPSADASVDSSTDFDDSRDSVSVEEFYTPDGTAYVIEDFAENTITVIDGSGHTIIHDRSEVIQLSERAAAEYRSQGVMLASNGWLCNFVAGIAGGLQGSAWQKALTILQINPWLRGLVSVAQIAAWAGVTTQC